MTLTDIQLSLVLSEHDCGELMPWRIYRWWYGIYYDVFVEHSVFEEPNAEWTPAALLRFIATLPELPAKRARKVPA